VLSQFKEPCLPPFPARNAADAPVLIVTTFVEKDSGFNPDGEPTNELGNGWGFYDLGLHNENMILKARDLGLDTLVMGIRDADKIRAMLHIPAEEIVVSVIAVGYAAHEAKMPPRKSVDEILKFF
jgi:nitroreductase